MHCHPRGGEDLDWVYFLDSRLRGNDKRGMYIQSNISDSLKTRRRKKVLVRLFLGVFLCLIIFANICFISRIDMLQIHEIKILNRSSISDDDIKGIVDNILSQDYVYFISKRNFLVIPKVEIENNILNKFIKLSEAKVFLMDKERLVVEVKDREIKAKWCDDEASGPLQCYFLDKDGLIFAPVPELFGNSIITFLGKLKGEKILGNYYDQGLSFVDLFAFCEALEKIKLPVMQLVTADDYYEVILKGGAKIYFDDKQELNKTLENIQSLVESKTIETSSEFLNKLNHLDLRYGNKVHFDFR